MTEKEGLINKIYELWLKQRSWQRVVMDEEFNFEAARSMSLEELQSFYDQVRGL